MSAPQEGYPPQGYPQQEQYGEQQPQPGFGAAAPAPAEEHHDGHGKKKKRGYAAQAYDFGAGGNAALGGQPPNPENFAPVGAPAYGGYPAAADQPAYGRNQPYTDTPQPSTFGQSALGGLGGYQAPQQPAAYPAPGAPPGGDVGGITQGMGQMGIAPQAGQPGAGAVPRVALNQLYPTDLLNQPFNVAEIELPPPPIILPPNVSWDSCLTEVIWLISLIVKRHTVAGRKLLAQIHTLYSECSSNDQQSLKKVEASICPRHTTIHFFTRCG